MIEDKKLGLKIATDSNEAFWEETRKKCVSMIENSKHEIELDEHILKLCDEKLKTFKKVKI